MEILNNICEQAYIAEYSSSHPPEKANDSISTQFTVDCADSKAVTEVTDEKWKYNISGCNISAKETDPLS